MVIQGYMTIQIWTIHIPIIQIVKKHLKDYFSKSDKVLKKMKNIYVDFIEIYKPLFFLRKILNTS